MSEKIVQAPLAAGQYVNFPEGGRVVFVNGRQSWLMDGDTSPPNNTNGGALPALLASSWKIGFVLPAGPDCFYFFLTPPR